MPPDPGRLRTISSQTGFRMETLEKVVRLGEVMSDIAKHPLLSRVLLLKGGTALNLCFGEPRRLSVDLDFNYVGHLDRKAMLAERPTRDEGRLLPERQALGVSSRFVHDRAGLTAVVSLWRRPSPSRAPTQDSRWAAR